MATKKKIVEVEAAEDAARYKGSQLLKIARYNNRIARISLKPERYYSFAEADELINNYLKKKG